MGRIIATRLGFALNADPIPGFPNTSVRLDGNDYSSYPVQTLGDRDFDLESVLSDRTKRKIVLNGYFQRYDYFRPYKEVIRNDWLVMDYPQDVLIGESDIVATVRLTDYFYWGSVLPFAYYEKALRMTSFGRLFICTDDVRDPFLRRFKKYGAIILPHHPLRNFKLLMSFPKIILSQSTYYWWAAFLSNAKEIYAPIPSFGYWSQPTINVRVADEPRYVYIPWSEPHKVSFIEGLERKTRSIFVKGHKKVKNFLLHNR